jgi:hypothetical protein
MPKGARKTFSIVKDVKYADGRRVQTTVEVESLKALNENFLSGLIGIGDADLQTDKRYRRFAIRIMGCFLSCEGFNSFERDSSFESFTIALARGKRNWMRKS